MDDVILEALQLPLAQRLRRLRLLSESIEAAPLVEDEEEDRLDLAAADEVRAALKDGREQILSSDEVRRALGL